MTERKEVTAVMAPRYQRVRKKNRQRILHEFVALIGYQRFYASFVLSSHGRRKRIGTSPVIVVDARKQEHRRRAKVYGEEVRRPPVTTWHLMDRISGSGWLPLWGGRVILS